MSAFTIYLAVLMAAGPVQTDAAPARSQSELEAAADQLGASKYEIRQQATELLWSAGEAAIPALERVVQNRNSEVRSRARYVLENLRQGIAFNTPREILREVQRFREGGVEDKRLALKNLESGLRPRIVLGLIQSERELRLRDEWSQFLERSIQAALLAGMDRDVELTLNAAATNDVWLRHWVSYLAARGLLDQELSRLGQSKSAANELDHARRMAYLLRAKGDLSEARRFAEQAQKAEKAENARLAAAQKNRSMLPTERIASFAQSSESGPASDLAWQLILEQRDWTTAARQLKVRIESDPDAGKDPETLGFALAYHRLAGDNAGSEHYLKMLRDMADEVAKSISELDPTRVDAETRLLEKQWHIGKVLMLNGEYSEAVKILRRNNGSFAFELLASQNRFREAFDVAGVAYPKGIDTAWLVKIAKETASNKDDVRPKFVIAMHALRQLYSLGEREQAKQLLALIQRATANDSSPYRRQIVCETAVRLGIRQVVAEVGAVLLEREGNASQLATLYPNHTSVATVWWEFFRETPTKEPIVQTLTRIDRCLLLQEPGLEKAELEQLIADAEAKLPQLVETKRAEWCHGLAETCWLQGERSRALRLFELAAALSSVDALRLGDSFAGDKNWPDAAEWYRRASEFDKTKPLPLYLYGRALIEAGRKEEGEQLASLAMLLPMGNDESRRELAVGMKERGYRDESLRQFELLVRTGEPGERDVIEAAKQIGNGVYLQDEMRAADCWERMLLCCLRSRWGFGDANGYVQIPLLVHKTRAKGLLKSGRIDEGLREIQAALVASPLNLEVPEELIPELQKVTRQAEAEQLLESFYQGLRQQCLDFPNCAMLHNELAWLLGLNGRSLEEALEHVQAAIRLDPNNSAYIDTLGEVQFRRGNVDEAITCAERCLKIDSRSKHYQEQLARFRAASGNRAKPSEN